MKKIFILLMLLFVFSASFAQNGNIKLTITNIQSTKGVVMVGLYDKASSFPTVGMQIKTIKFKLSKKGTIHCNFETVPNGNYAIAIWHDKNENGKLDKNFFGMPKENYGFSNNVFGTFGAPSFSQASFKVDGNVTNLKIDLK